MSNPNRWVFTTDWHVVSNNSESGLAGETHPDAARALCQYMNSVAPHGIIDMGDCKDHYGNEAAVGDEMDQYVANVLNVMNWKTPAADLGFNALYPVLPGNHDEILDYDEAGATDFSVWEARMWPAPYHWYIDWEVPLVRFIGIHAYIVHDPDPLAGFFQIDTDETDWLEEQLDALPVGYKAIICSHAPIDPEFGNEIHVDKGGTALRAVIAANSAKILACFSGHRHLNGPSHTLSGVLHVCCPCVAYTADNTSGGWFLMEYNGSTSITCHYRTGQPSLMGAAAISVYTPIVLTL